MWSKLLRRRYQWICHGRLSNDSRLNWVRSVNRTIVAISNNANQCTLSICPFSSDKCSIDRCPTILQWLGQQQLHRILFYFKSGYSLKLSQISGSPHLLNWVSEQGYWSLGHHDCNLGNTVYNDGWFYHALEKQQEC